MQYAFEHLLRESTFQNAILLTILDTASTLKKTITAISTITTYMIIISTQFIQNQIDVIHEKITGDQYLDHQ